MRSFLCGFCCTMPVFLACFCITIFLFQCDIRKIESSLDIPTHPYVNLTRLIPHKLKWICGRHDLDSGVVTIAFEPDKDIDVCALLKGSNLILISEGDGNPLKWQYKDDEGIVRMNLLYYDEGTICRYEIF